MEEIFNFIVVMAIVCPFMHFLAFIGVAAIADILEKKKEDFSSTDKLIYIIIWLIIFFGSGIVAQFFVDLAMTGLFLGALLNVFIAFFWLKNHDDFLGNTMSWVAIYATPIIGYFIGDYVTSIL